MKNSGYHPANLPKSYMFDGTVLAQRLLDKLNGLDEHETWLRRELRQPWRVLPPARAPSSTTPRPR